MNEKLLMIIFAFIIFTILNLLIKLINYSFKAKKYGIKTEAIIVGYYMYYETKIIMWYPVVKFIKMNGEEIIAKSRLSISFPVYKIGEKIFIQYYADEISNMEYKDVYIDRFSKNKEKMYIDSGIRFNILDLKHLLDVFLEGLILIVLFFLCIYK